VARSGSSESTPFSRILLLFPATILISWF
jgi:hypothetical protein